MLSSRLAKPQRKRLDNVANLLSDSEFTAMMAEFDQAGAWMQDQLRAQRGGAMNCREQHVISPARDNLDELDVIKPSARKFGTDALEPGV